MNKRTTTSYQDVFEQLKQNGGKTIEALSEAIGTSKRTLRYGVRVLNDANMLTVTLDRRDLRHRVYHLKPEYARGPCPIQH
jgi:DNA-binding transcriptional ArsR family regulator